MWGILPVGDTVRDIDWWNHMDEERERYLFGRYGSFFSNLAHDRWQEQLEEIRINRDKAMASDAPITDFYPLVRSQEQVIPIIDSIANDIQRIFQINMLNKRGQLDGVSNNIAVETEGMICGAGVFPIITPRLPDKIIDCILLPYQIECDLKVNAFINKDPNLILQLMLLHSHTKDLAHAERWLDLWLNRPGYEEVTKRYK
jgi:alpha-galactosidase